MKHDLINTGSNRISNECREVTFVKRASNLLAVGAVALIAVSAVGFYAVSDGKDISANDYIYTASSEQNDVSSSESSSADTVSQVEMTWKKAGIDEYDLVVETVKATKNMNKLSTAKNTAENAVKSAFGGAYAGMSAKKMTADIAAEKSIGETAAFIEADSEDPIKDCGVMTMYTMEEVNLRQEASLNSDILRVLAQGYEVTVTGYNSDWYRIKANGQTGYCLKRYLSSDMPEHVSAQHEGDIISYDDTEFEMLCYVLQNEVGNCSEASKIAVANVIINRVRSPLFPNSIAEVLTQNDQFTAIYNYYNRVSDPNENTIQCARRALSGEDNTNGAIYYYAPQYSSSASAAWFESLTFCMEIDGQRYFK